MLSTNSDTSQYTAQIHWMDNQGKWKVKVCMCALRSLYIEMLEIYDALEIFAQWSMYTLEKFAQWSMLLIMWKE